MRPLTNQAGCFPNGFVTEISKFDLIFFRNLGLSKFQHKGENWGDDVFIAIMGPIDTFEGAKYIALKKKEFKYRVSPTFKAIFGQWKCSPKKSHQREIWRCWKVAFCPECKPMAEKKNWVENRFQWTRWTYLANLELPQFHRRNKLEYYLWLKFSLQGNICWLRPWQNGLKPPFEETQKIRQNQKFFIQFADSEDSEGIKMSYWRQNSPEVNCYLRQTRSRSIV